MMYHTLARLGLVAAIVAVILLPLPNGVRAEARAKNATATPATTATATLTGTRMSTPGPTGTQTPFTTATPTSILTPAVTSTSTVSPPTGTLAYDNFAFPRAIDLTTLPFTDVIANFDATRESGEPYGCAYIEKTVWYSITPTADMWLEIDTAGSTVPNSNVALYQAISPGLSGLQPICAGMPIRVRVLKDVTYYVQASTSYSPPYPTPGNLQVNVRPYVPPPPYVNIGSSPLDPSVFDTVQFYSYSYDPVALGIQTWAWDFGDGATSAAQYATHQYAADGSYTVQHTVITVDGRTATASLIVVVKTHDVSIERFSTPNSARVGQARTVEVQVSSRRGDETVTVQLFKSNPSVPGGFELVGSLTQWVQTRSGNRGTQFPFQYVFTSQDANIGRVTFKATATIVGARDALWADNEAIALPTNVGR